jgi:hypothetical protein
VNHPSSNSQITQGHINKTTEQDKMTGLPPQPEGTYAPKRPKIDIQNAKRRKGGLPNKEASDAPFALPVNVFQPYLPRHLPPKLWYSFPMQQSLL